MGHKVLFRFKKDEGMIYISHLDLLRLFARAARRAALPLSLSQGFHPHPKIKLKRALKLGLASSNEEGELELQDKIEETKLLKRLQLELPAGISISEVKYKDYV